MPKHLFPKARNKGKVNNDFKNSVSRMLGLFDRQILENQNYRKQK